MYAKTTKDKNKEPRSIDDVMRAYDSGELLVPCVKLQCIGFDVSVYQAMLGVAGGRPKPKASLSSISSSSNKRMLEEYGADAEVSIPKRRSRNRP